MTERFSIWGQLTRKDQPPPEVGEPPLGEPERPGVHNDKKRRAARLRKEENMTKREQTAKVRKEKATIRAKKKKEQEDIQ